jgi:hypothetical protein
MIQETKLGFNFNPKNSTLNYPQCRCGMCPAFYWNLLSVASRGSGKTYNIVKLIKHYEDNKLLDNDGLVHPLRTIVISPTLDANLIFNNLKSLADEDKHDKYSDELLQSIVDGIKKDKEETDQYQKYIQAYKKAIKIKEEKLNNFFENHPEIYDILLKFNFDDPENIPQPKYLVSPVVIIVLDDMMGSADAFSNKKASVLLNNLIKNRHNAISFAILVQSVKSVQKSVRANCNLFFIGKFASSKILDDFMEDVANVVNEEQFKELYDFCVKENQYGSLIIDTTRKDKRFLSGLDSMLSFVGEKT